jgi:hypothetical protein
VLFTYPVGSRGTERVPPAQGQSFSVHIGDVKTLRLQVTEGNFGNLKKKEGTN